MFVKLIWVLPWLPKENSLDLDGLERSKDIQASKVVTRDVPSDAYGILMYGLLAGVDEYPNVAFPFEK